MHVVIVESPAKARTVRGCLGAGHTVIATGGHVRDLPAKDGSVDPAGGFAIAYATRHGKAPTLRAIAKALEEADALVLATDPDREGEAIAWQVLSWLEDNGALGATPVRRVVFHEVTREAVLAAMARPRALDMDLVRAQQARRALDYLVGFHLSPVLWRKVRGGRSAGRVQSVALRLLCAREAELEDFAPREYWSVEAGVTAERGGSFTARLAGLDGEPLDRFALGSAKSAEAAARHIREGVFRVAKLERDTVRRNPVPPFTTATLQQEASRRLGFGVRKTMQLAQALFEGVELDRETAGLITYMRTDSVALSKGAVAAARKIVRDRFGRDYLPRRPRVFRSRARNAQEAHEAIRPTDLARTPEAVEGRLGEDQAALYALIWRRAVASQMAAAKLDRVRVELASAGGDVVLTASGATTRFDGFLRVYREDGGEEGEVEPERALPAMAEGERAFVTEVRTARRFTRPPSRYTEADLVGALEERGIGRPSTYAVVVGVLRERGYAVLYRRRFVPTERGRVVTAFLERYFAQWVAYGFTTAMEADLDRVAAGGAAWTGVLEAFWGPFEGAVEAARELRREDIRDALENALERYLFAAAGEPVDRACPDCDDGELMLKLGRFGPFVSCANFPDCRHSRPLSGDPAEREEARRPVVLGTDAETGLALTLRRGRYGRYIQRGEDEGKTRALRRTVPASMEADDITPELARALLALPRIVGVHPETGKTIRAGIGRYGAWLKHGATYVPLPDDEDVLAVGLNRAVALVDARIG